MPVKAIILRTAGTNCDLESEFALKTVGASVERIHVEYLLSGKVKLEDYHFFFIPGGFSYGDDIAAGRVLANEIKNLLGEQIDRFLDKGGLVLGVCNGFQVLVKIGLLPYLTSSPSLQRFSLVHNDCGRFVDRWVHLRTYASRCVYISDDEVLELPVAHGEGKFIASDNSEIDELFQRELVVFQYVAPEGGEAKYPHNPNGSYRGVAGVCDESGRILGLMPHPERYISPYQHPRHTREGLKAEGDGVRIFRNAVEYIRKEVL